MLNLFKLSPLTYLLLTSLALNLALGTATYKLHASKAVSDAALETCSGVNDSLVLELSKKEAVCTIQDQVVAEYNLYKDDIRSEEDTLLDALDNIPSETTQTKVIEVEQLEAVVKKKAEQTEVTNETYVNLDSLLPPDFRGLLESAHSRATNKN